MGRCDTTDAGADSTDLYSRVKLRASNKKVNCVVNDVYATDDGKSATAMLDMSDLLLDEGTAIEMLHALRKKIPKNSRNDRDIGDLVWGRVKSFPWWPAQIFDEALASPSVRSNKRDGTILVAFYGDYTYAWLAPSEIVPFDINFDENLKQTEDHEFLTGVKEAIAEIKSRVALSLTCHCQNNSNLQSMMMVGNSVRQIQKAREDFRPQEIIYFLKHLALSPRKNVKKNPYWIKFAANIFAYRKAVVKEFDETCSQSFKGQHKGLECPAGITKANQKDSQAQLSGLLDAEAVVKTKCLSQHTEVYDLQKKDELNILHGCQSTKSFEDHELQIKCEESEHFRQEGPYDLHKFSAKRKAVEYDIHSRGLSTRSDRAEHLGDNRNDSSQHTSVVRSSVKISPSIKNCPGDASRNICRSSKGLREQIRPNDLANTSNKRRTLGHREDFGMERPVRMNKLEYLARFAANQQDLELQGESQMGIRSGSSTQPQKDSQITQESTRRDVKERMLTIKFPPQTILPSVSEVKAKFACFGPLDEYSTCFLRKSSAYQLVFLHKSDAEVAYRHAIQNSALFSTSEVRYYLQATDHDLNESGNSSGQVENQEEIQLASSLNSNEFATKPMSASFEPSLPLPEKNQLKSSVEKLSAESSDCPRSHSLENKTDNSEIPKNAVPLSFPSNFPPSSTTKCTTNEQYGIEQFVEDINKGHCQVEAMKNNDSQNTTIANNTDISHQLINLLSSCGGILGELNSAYEHMF